MRAYIVGEPEQVYQAFTSTNFAETMLNQPRVTWLLTLEGTGDTTEGGNKEGGRLPLNSSEDGVYPPGNEVGGASVNPSQPNHPTNLGESSYTDNPDIPLRAAWTAELKRGASSVKFQLEAAIAPTATPGLSALSLAHYMHRPNLWRRLFAHLPMFGSIAQHNWIYYLADTCADT